MAPRKQVAQPAPQPAEQPAPEAPADGDAAADYVAPEGMEIVTISAAGDGKVSDGEGGFCDAGDELLVSDAVAAELKANGLAS